MKVLWRDLQGVLRACHLGNLVVPETSPQVGFSCASKIEKKGVFIFGIFLKVAEVFFF